MQQARNWFGALSVPQKLLAIGLALVALVLTSPVTAGVASLVFLVALVAVVVRALRRPPLPRRRRVLLPAHRRVPRRDRSPAAT